jgi:type II secretory pathway component PulJ
MLATALALLFIVALLACSFLSLAAANAARTKHQERGVQALAAAEAGVEWALDRAARYPDQAAGARLDLDPGRSAVVQVSRQGPDLVIIARGEASDPGWQPVERTVRVACRREAGRWRAVSWQPVYPNVDRPTLRPVVGESHEER